MTGAQITLFTLLGVTMALFAWGRWRYDVVAVFALLVALAAGLVPTSQAFAGFGHPAVITVAAVLLISESMQACGIVERLSRLLAPTRIHPVVQLGAANGLTAIFSAFMNNIGALALMLPVALRNAERARIPASMVLMPLAFASLLGGLVTLIGTPPNIIIAAVRAEHAGDPFRMFDFAPVGLPLAIAGVVFLSVLAWRWLPSRNARGDGTDAASRLGVYVTEGRVGAGSSLIEREVVEIEELCGDEVVVTGIFRGGLRIMAPRGITRLLEGDLVFLEGDPANIEPLFQESRLERTGKAHLGQRSELGSDSVRITEAVLMPHSPLIGQSIRDIHMRERYGLNLLAVSSQQRHKPTRLKLMRLSLGDVLLVQGERSRMRDTLRGLGCLPLADRGLRVSRPRNPLPTISIFAAAVLCAALFDVPVAIAFVAAVALLLVSGNLDLRDLYRKIDWPIIVLLGALIPLGKALQVTGGTGLIAGALLGAAQDLPAWALVALLMGVSMLMSDLIHNTPTAVVMGPVAIAVAERAGLSTDALLMAVAIGAASPYLTPVGHQSNTLVMGPGGYKFTDYARLGVPLDVLLLAIGVPLIVAIWL